MAMPTAADVFALLEGYHIDDQISEQWILDCRDTFIVPWVEAKTRQTMGRIEERTEYYDGNGSSLLILRTRPIVDLLTVSYTNVVADQYYLSPTSIEVLYEEGILKAKANFQEANYTPIFVRGVRNIRVKYTVGYLTIPGDITRAIKALVAEQALGQIASRTGGGNVSASSFSRQYGERGKFTQARNDLARAALALLRKYMTGVGG